MARLLRELSVQNTPGQDCVRTGLEIADGPCDGMVVHVITKGAYNLQLKKKLEVTMKRVLSKCSFVIGKTIMAWHGIPISISTGNGQMGKWYKNKNLCIITYMYITSR